MPFRKSDPLADAQSAVDALETRLRPLADRLATADARVEAAKSARRDAFVNGNPDAEATAALDRAVADAIEARGGVFDAVSTVEAQIADAVLVRDSLRETASRAQLADAAEARAAALDHAAEGMAAAAQAFSDARDVMVAALRDHGVRVANPLSTDGSTSPALLATPIVRAALKMAAPTLHPAVDGLGVAVDSDPVMVTRRSQSGRLRDHAEDLRTGMVPPVEMPRPGSMAPDPVRDNRNSSLGHEPMTRAAFTVPFSYLAKGGVGMVQSEGGDVEVPLRVALAAKDMDLAFDLDSPEGKAITARARAGGKPRSGLRVFIDTDAEVDAPTRAIPARTVTSTWPDERGATA